MTIHRHRHASVLVSFFLAAAAIMPTGMIGASGAAMASAVSVSGLTMDGRSDNPLGVDDPTPDLHWIVTGGDQTAYEIRAASSTALLPTPDLWDTGKVVSTDNTGIIYAGVPLASRQPVAWQVRVWDATDTPSAWSAPSRWEMGLLTPSDWGASRWIDYPGKTDAQPQPIFARGFAADPAKTVKSGRLYISGLGTYVATVNGQNVTDNALQPGYSLWARSAEYGTYDITGLLQSGANTVGVQLGNGRANVNSSQVNAATGRTSPYLRDGSSNVGAGTLAAAAAAGDTSIRPSTTTAYLAGETLNVDTGNGGDNLESRTITGVFPSASTTLAYPAAIGDTNLKVASVTNLGVGATLTIDTGANVETRTITAVGSAASSTTLAYQAAAGDTNVKVSSVSGMAAGGTLLIDTGASQQSVTITSVGTAASTATTTMAAVNPGDTNVKVSSITGFTAGGQLVIDSAGTPELATVASVGTAGASTTMPSNSTTLGVTSTTLVGPTTAGVSTVTVANNTGFTPGLSVGIDTGANAETATVASTTTTGIVVPLYPASPNPPIANWIWSTATGTSSAIGPAYLRKNFTVADPSLVTSAPLRINADDSGFIYVNGISLGQTSTVSNGWRNSTLVDIASMLVPGNNVIALQVINPSSSGSAITALELHIGSSITRYVSDTSWKALAGNPASGPAGWTTQGFDDSAWGNAFISTAYGGSPWGTTDTVPTGTATYTITFSAPLANAHAASTILGTVTPAGVTNLKVNSVTGFAVGDSVTIDTGTLTEIASISAVGTAGAAGTGLTLAAPTTLAHTGAVAVARVVAPAGATNIKVASVTGFAVGDTMTIGSGATMETLTVTAVGTSGASGTGITFAPALAALHPATDAVRDLGTGVTLTSGFALAHASGVAIRNLGTGVTFTPALTAAHATAATVAVPGTGVTIDVPLTLAHATGATVTQTIAITFTPALGLAHASGVSLSGSGLSIPDASNVGTARVTDRLIGRVEINYTDGSSDVVVTDRSWQTAFGPIVSEGWYSGDDYDARREQPGWDMPGADLTATATRRNGSLTGWISAGFAPPPSLATRLIWHSGEPVRFDETIVPIAITHPNATAWVYDFGQNFAGMPALKLDPGVPAGTTVRMQPAESLNADGTVSSGSLGSSSQIFHTYTTWGDPAGESWQPGFNYFGMQYLQVTGLPAGYTPTTATITGLHLRGATPIIGTVSTDNAMLTRLDRMMRYSVMSNMMAQFTDCPGREKLNYPADYMFAMDSIDQNYDMSAYLRWNEYLMTDSQVRTGPSLGAVGQKLPVTDSGVEGRFGYDPNWGGGIILVPWHLYTQYGNSRTIALNYESMKAYETYLIATKMYSGAMQYLLPASLGDWIAPEATNTDLVGSVAFYNLTRIMAQSAAMTGHTADAATYTDLANNIYTAFNNYFFNTTLHMYTQAGNASTSGATQVAQALALDYGLVPAAEHDNVVQALVNNIYAYHPFGGGAHFSGGTVGLQSIIGALTANGRDDVIWDALQETTRPSYGFFLQPSVAHPNGLTTMPEQWDLGSSQNHMITGQIDEWFHTGLAGINPAPDSIAFRQLVIKPKVVGTLTHVTGSFTGPQGEIASEWTRGADNRFQFTVTIPANTSAEIWVPTFAGHQVVAPADVTFSRTATEVGKSYRVYTAGRGTYAFDSIANTTTTVTANYDPTQYHHPVTFSATVAPVDPAVTAIATGNVQFSIDGSTVGGPVALDTAGVATLDPISNLAIGTHEITAVYAGDATHVGSTSVPVNHTVKKRLATATAVTSAGPVIFAAPWALTATVSPENASSGLAPAGSLQLKVDGVALGTPLPMAGGTVVAPTATLTIAPCSGAPAVCAISIAWTPAGSPAAGNHNVRAVYSGDANYTGSTSPTYAQQAKKATPAGSVVSDLASPIVQSQRPTFTATFTNPVAPAGSLTPANVQFLIDGTNMGAPVALDAAGSAAFHVTWNLPTGNHTIKAKYLGNANFAAVLSAGLSLKINP